MPLTYSTYVSQVANLMVISSADANFTIMLPGMIDYAEDRLYRELDPLYVQTTDATTTVSSGNRNFTLPGSSNVIAGVFVTVDQINIITPATALSSNGTRNPLIPTSREFLDTVYPSGQTVTGVPIYYAMANPEVAIFGPAPDQAYTAEVIGVQRPTPLSVSNTSTYLCSYYPDLFIAASMVFASGYMRDFGREADTPQSGASWETQYQLLLKSAMSEQARSKFEGEAWTSQSQATMATPPRV